MNNELILSFVLPCYNVENYISKCLDSLLCQDIPHQEYEIICVDDCSMDRTKELIIDYQTRYRNIRIISLEQKTSSGNARNIGMDNATGEYIWFVDSDDMIEPNSIGKLISVCKKSNLDELLFNFDVVDGDDKFIERSAKFSNSERISGIQLAKEYFNNQLSDLSIIWRQIYNHDYLKKNNIRFPDIHMGEDGPFAWKSLILAEKIKTIDKSYYKYRRNTFSMTKSYEKKITAIYLFEKTFKFSSAVFELSEELKSVDIGISDQLFNIASFSLNNCLNEIIKASVKEQKNYYFLCIKYRKDIDNYYALMSVRNKTLIKLTNFPFIIFYVYIVMVKWIVIKGII